MAKGKTKADIQAELDVVLSELEQFKSAQQGGVIAQLRTAFSTSWLAAVTGCLLGAFVPVAIWWLVHNDLAKDWQKPALVLVLGGLAFSAKTVFQWTREAFACGYKAFGFTILLEGVLALSEAQWLSLTALGYLAVVNAAATASTLASVDRS